MKGEKGERMDGERDCIFMRGKLTELNVSRQGPLLLVNSRLEKKGKRREVEMTGDELLCDYGAK
jgi:hypothetical protein